MAELGEEQSGWEEAKAIRDLQSTCKDPTGQKGALRKTFVPKRRITIPGHLDPQLGTYRCDAPIPPCAPEEGLPSVEGELPVSKWIVRSPSVAVFEAKELLEELKFEELGFCAGHIGKKGWWCGSGHTTLTCWWWVVGLWKGHFGKTSRKKLVSFLGVRTTYEGGIFQDDMSEYVEKIELTNVEAPKGQPLAGPQLTTFRKLTMQPGWPAHLAMPEYLFHTSRLAQTVSTATGADLEDANKILEQMKQSAAKGEAIVRIFPVKGGPF